MFHPFCILWYLFLGTIVTISRGDFPIGSKYHTEKIVVGQGESFVLALPVSKKDALPYPICQLERNGTVYDRYYRAPSGETLKNFYSRAYCGFKVRNVNRNSAGEWQLKLKNPATDREKRETDSQPRLATVSVLEPGRLDQCPLYPDDHCEIINLDTKATGKCGSVPDGWTDYECRFFSEGVMEQRIVVKRNAILEDVGPRKSDVRIEGNSAILECSYDNRPITNCTVEHISSKLRRFNIQEGLVFQSYSAFKTNFQDGVCQFEMPSPVPLLDAGLWKINLMLQDKLVANHQCEFQLQSTYAAPETSDTAQQLIIVKTTEKEAKISCAQNLPYPLTRCYLRQPNQDLKFQESLEAGICEFTVEPGIWHCGFNGKEPNQPDIFRHFEVVHYKKEAIEANVQDKTLSCRHIYHTPLKACIFVSPSGKIHSRPSDVIRSNGDLSRGNLMRDGICALSLEAPLEKGTWKCIIQLATNDKDFSDEIIVE